MAEWTLIYWLITILKQCNIYEPNRESAHTEGFNVNGSADCNDWGSMSRYTTKSIKKGTDIAPSSIPSRRMQVKKSILTRRKLESYVYNLIFIINLSSLHKTLTLGPRARPKLNKSNTWQKLCFYNFVFYIWWNLLFMFFFYIFVITTCRYSWFGISRW